MTEEWGAGRLVAGKYRLVSKLGEGGMGAVWRADHVTLRSEVALKLVSKSVLASEDGGLQRFMAEARAAALLRSPHVVQILDHGVDDGVPFMVMELLDGESLASRLTRVGTLSLAQTARLMTHVARAMSKAHEAGIIHRDLKPDNIFLVQNDDEELAKVLDFGVAKVTHALAEEAAKASTRTGALLGTPYYMSPEQVRGHKVDHRSDLWSLAVIAFECLVGRLPFNGNTVGDLLLHICASPIPVPSAVADVPAAFDAWFAKGVAREPEGRFQSARELAEALRVVAGELPTTGASGRFSAAVPRVSQSDAKTLVAGASPSADSLLASAPTIATDPARRKPETIGGSSLAPGEGGLERTHGRSPARGLFAAGALMIAVGLGTWLFLARSAAPPPLVPEGSAKLASPPPSAPPEVPAALVASAAPEIAPAVASAAPSASAPPGRAIGSARGQAPPRASATPKAAPTAAPVAPPKKKDELAF